MNLDAYDAEGRHTGRAANPNPASDLTYVEQQIPGSYYGEDAGDPHIGLSDAGTYHIALTGHAAGTFTVDIAPVLGGEEQVPIEFSDVPVTARASASLFVSMDAPSAASLAVDLDGDGTTDLTLSAGSGGTEDSGAYLQLVAASVGNLGIGKPTAQQLSAKSKNAQSMLAALNAANKKALLPQVQKKLDGMETYTQDAYRAGSITAGQAESLLQMLDHETALIQN